MGVMMHFKRILVSSLVRPNFTQSSARPFCASKGNYSSKEKDNTYNVTETSDYVTDISAEMGGNAKDSMIQGKQNTKRDTGDMKEKGYEMGGIPKDCMAQGKEITKDNASEMIKNNNRKSRDENSQDSAAEVVTNKASSMAKGAKDQVMGKIEKVKKTMEGYVGDVMRPAEQHRDKELDQTEYDVERRPLDEKKYG